MRSHHTCVGGDGSVGFRDRASMLRVLSVPSKPGGAVGPYSKSQNMLCAAPEHQQLLLSSWICDGSTTYTTSELEIRKCLCPFHQDQTGSRKSRIENNVTHRCSAFSPASGTPYSSARSMTCCSRACGLQRPSGGCSQSRISTHLLCRM